MTGSQPFGGRDGTRLHGTYPPVGTAAIRGAENGFGAAARTRDLIHELRGLKRYAVDGETPVQAKSAHMTLRIEGPGIIAGTNLIFMYLLSAIFMQ